MRAGERTRSLHALSRRATVPSSPLAQQPGSSPNGLLLGAGAGGEVMQASVPRRD